MSLRVVALIVLLLSVLAADDATALAQQLQQGSEVPDKQPANGTAPSASTGTPAPSRTSPPLGDSDPPAVASSSPSTPEPPKKESPSRTPTTAAPPAAEMLTTPTTAPPSVAKRNNLPKTAPVSSPPLPDIEMLHDSESPAPARPIESHPSSSTPVPRTTTLPPTTPQPSSQPAVRPRPTQRPVPTPTEPESPPPVPRLPPAPPSVRPVISASSVPATAPVPTPTPTPTPQIEDEDISPPPVPRLPPPETLPPWAVDPATLKPPFAALLHDNVKGAGSDQIASDSDSETSNLGRGESSGSDGPLAFPSSDSPRSSSGPSSASRLASTSPPVNPFEGSSDSGSHIEPVEKTGTLAATSRGHASAFHDSAACIGVTCAALSLALLIVFHTLSVEAFTFDWPQGWLRVNGWELLLYACYLQQLTSLSHLDLLDAPPFVRQFTDAFSWCSFIILRTSIASLKDSAPSLPRLAGESIHGVAEYAVRIGIPRSDLLLQAIYGLLVAAGVLVIVFVLLLACGGRVEEDKFDVRSSSTSVVTQQTAFFHCRGAQTVLGFLVVLWFLTLYPVAAFASFDLVIGESDSLLAVAIVVVFCIVILGALAAAIIPQSDERLMSMSSLKLFGALHADMTHGFRWFFIFSALTQVALGICAGAVTDETTQLTVALVIVAGYLATVLLCSPFTSQTPLLFTTAVCVVKIVNYTIAFAFLSDKSVSLGGEERAGDAILAINMAVLLLWLARLLAMLFIFVPLYVQHRASSPSSPTPEHLVPDHRPSIKDDNNNTSAGTNHMHDGSGVFVTMVTPMGPRLGSEFDIRGLDGELGSHRRTARLAVM